MGTVTWGDFHPATYFQWAGIGIVTGFGSGIVSLGIFYCAPQVSIVAANVLVALVFVGLGVVYIYLGFIYGAVLMFIVAAIRLVILYLYRKHIPISGLILKQATILSKRQPMTTIIAFLTLLVCAGWCCFAFATAYPTIADAWNSDNDSNGNNNSGPSTGAMIGMWFFFLFSCFWASQVAFNVGHTTNCGVTATWYFCGQDSMPSNPTLHSAKRALTTSFGSICFGSLLVAILQTIRALLNAFANSRDQNCCAAFCFCILDCILACIERLLELFNKFAFVFVAIYGYGYIDAAKRTMGHAKRSLFTPLFNDMLVSSTLYIFQLGFAVLMAVIAYFGSGGNVNDLQWESMLIAAMCGFWTMLTMWLFFKVIDSAVTAIYVCLADVPEALHVTNPEFAAEFNSEVSGITLPSHQA
eukprot:GDKJ01024233.1.p1 GENE.GDKJ01024233.1~~GDKJ01024233.1.p1  ORF type:complete len:482 (-),score=55.96 GDKJ01024233.1:306-1544(-)